MSLPLIPMHSVVLGVRPRINVLEIVHRLARILIHIVPLRFLIHPVTDGILERIAWVQHHTPMLEPQLILGCAVSHRSNSFLTAYTSSQYTALPSLSL